MPIKLNSVQFFVFHRKQIEMNKTIVMEVISSICSTLCMRLHDVLDVCSE